MGVSKSLSDRQGEDIRSKFLTMWLPNFVTVTTLFLYKLARNV